MARKSFGLAARGRIMTAHTRSPPLGKQSSCEKAAALSPDVKFPEAHNVAWQVSLIVLAELLCTSLWFSANGAAAELKLALSLSDSDFGLLTNSVQAGFIVGTLYSSMTGLADRFAASRIFVISALVGAGANAVFALLPSDFVTAFALRFVVGVSLAGIYPIGMKVILGWTRGGSSVTLSLLVGTLAFGTALPHGIRAFGAGWSWQVVVISCSVLCVMGGLLVLAVGDGPFVSKNATDSQGACFGAGLLAFKERKFRSAALGYFGHMWELYAFWSLAPMFAVALLPEWTSGSQPHASMLAFLVVGSGSIGCLVGGVASLRWGSQWVAASALFASGLMCALIPLSAGWPLWVRTACLMIWGMSVVADSPQFANLSRNACPPQLVGSALSIQNAIGFAITTISIWIGAHLFADLALGVAWILLPGPMLGLVGMYVVGGKAMPR
jgi:MFS family permease